MDDDYLYHHGKQPGRTYVSKVFREWSGDADSRPMRYVSKVVDSDSTDECVVEGREVVIEQTAAGKKLEHSSISKSVLQDRARWLDASAS